MNKHKQNGMTGLGWLIVLALIGLFALVAIRLFPMYAESYEVAGSLESLKNEPFITDKSPAEVASLLQRRFDVNDIKSVDRKKDVKIVKEDGVLKVTVAYESRKHLLGNLDVVGVFNKHVEINAR